MVTLRHATIYPLFIFSGELECSWTRDPIRCERDLAQSHRHKWVYDEETGNLTALVRRPIFMKPLALGGPLWRFCQIEFQPYTNESWNKKCLHARANFPKLSEITLMKGNSCSHRAEDFFARLVV